MVAHKQNETSFGIINEFLVNIHEEKNEKCGDCWGYTLVPWHSSVQLHLVMCGVPFVAQLPLAANAELWLWQCAEHENNREREHHLRQCNGYVRKRWDPNK